MQSTVSAKMCFMIDIDFPVTNYLLLRYDTTLENNHTAKYLYGVLCALVLHVVHVAWRVVACGGNGFGIII